MKKVTVLMAVLAALSSCADEPESFSAVHQSIQHFDASGPNLNFTSQIELVTTGMLGMTQVAQVVEGIAKGIQAGLPGLSSETKHVQLQLHFTSADRLGNKGAIDFGTMRFPVEDLKKVKLENLLTLQLLNLADEISAGPAFNMAFEYCGDPDNRSVNGEFCAKVEAL